jgi:hypothetical protein
MLRRQSQRGALSKPFQSHFGSGDQRPRGDVESNYFSSPTPTRRNQPSGSVQQIHSHPAVDDGHEIHLDAFGTSLASHRSIRVLIILQTSNFSLSSRLSRKT